MSSQTVSAVPTIEWDDGVVFIFSFGDPTLYAGVVHVQVAQATASGTQTQVSAILQTLNQTQIQVASDPQSWLDTVKTAARGGKAINITYDTAFVHYTTQIATSYDLQLLYSLAG